ncbi:unnamed protein product [Arctogadus glacialis]
MEQRGHHVCLFTGPGGWQLAGRRRAGGGQQGADSPLVHRREPSSEQHDHGVNMAHNRSCLFEEGCIWDVVSLACSDGPWDTCIEVPPCQAALDRSESQRDGGFKHSWGFSLSAEEEKRHENLPPSDSLVAALLRQTCMAPAVPLAPILSPGVTMEERDRLQHSAPEGKKTPPFRQFSSADHSRTYENRASQHSRALSKLGPVKRPGDVPHMVPVPPAGPNRARSFIPSPSAPQGMVLQGRYFQHAHNVAAVRKPAPSVPSLLGSEADLPVSLSSRNDFSTQPTVELDQIILTCPDTQENVLNIKRRVQQKRKSLLEESCSFASAEPLRPSVSPARCIKCNSTTQDAACCSHCGHPRTPLPPCQQAPQAAPPSAAPRPPVHPHHAGGPHSLSGKNFYGPVRGSPGAAGPVLPPRVSHGARGGPLLAPLNGRPAGPPPLPPPGTSGCCGLRPTAKGKKSASARQHELNDPSEYPPPPPPPHAPPTQGPFWTRVRPPRTRGPPWEEVPVGVWVGWTWCGWSLYYQWLLPPRAYEPA